MGGVERRRVARRVARLGIAVALSLGACSSADRGSRDGSGQPADTTLPDAAPPGSPASEALNQARFADAINNRVHINYQVLETTAELAALCELVVVGPMSEILPGGRAIGLGTSLLVVRDYAPVKGDASGPLYIELLHSPLVTTEELAAMLPRAQGMWLLQDQVTAPRASDDHDRRKSLPAGERLWSPASPQALVLESPEGRLTMPSPKVKGGSRTSATIRPWRRWQTPS